MQAVFLDKQKNVLLRGRKRFAADLEDMREASKGGFAVHAGLTIKRLRPGDDDGTIEFTVFQGDHQLLQINLLVSDTSEYPENHVFYAFSPDTDIPPAMADVIQDLSNQRARTMQEIIRNLLFNFARTSDLSAQDSLMQDASEDEVEDDGDMADYEEDMDLGFGTSVPEDVCFDTERLQLDFVETIADDYRPGIIRLAGDKFVLSISLPVVDLVRRVSPRVLMAWDRRLLARTQHLTLVVSGLQGAYPILKHDGTYSDEALHRGVSLSFKVGLTKRYKPSKEHAAELVRTFGLVAPVDECLDDVECDLPHHAVDVNGDPMLDEDAAVVEEEKEDDVDPGCFERFSLSASLESLLENRFMRVLQFRIKFNLGWAGAEVLLAEVERSQKSVEEIFPGLKKSLRLADKKEVTLAESYTLPMDPLRERDGNLPLNLPHLAFAYLLRRLMLCTRFCLVCHNTISSDYEVIKPYVCDSKLCTYQYYNLNRGPSLEYEICHNTETVDLLVSLAYSAAVGGALNDPLPIGLGLRVPVPNGSYDGPPTRVNVYSAYTHVSPPQSAPAVIGHDGLCDFDALPIGKMRAAIATLIDLLPSITNMKKHLEKKTKPGASKPKLSDMDPKIVPAACWSVLRWCIGSCTAHLEELRNAEDKVHNIDSSWRQFRFSVGAPEAEATFKTAVLEAQRFNRNCIKYPSLFAFHGSSLKNWHSIIRHGLWFKEVAHGRSFGDGVYFAKDGQTSMHGYAGAGTVWKSSNIRSSHCVALAEIVNLPDQFVSQSPYFVVNQTKWIMCRYLLVNNNAVDKISAWPPPAPAAENPESEIPFVPLDPCQQLTLNQKRIAIPQPSYKLEKLVAARNLEYVEEDNDEDDVLIFAPPPPPPPNRDVFEVIKEPSVPGNELRLRVDDDWVHDGEWVTETVGYCMPPPVEATPMATMALQKELKAMLREQDHARSLRELGWYMPPDIIGDNLFQWIVELHSFDKDIPIAKDMKANNINSFVFEIRFPPTYPHSPPFFRILKPRLLPFINGGGGHVTAGGSMCMDLLTTDGWLPSYSISAVLLQIKLAISNLEPRPARLAKNWTDPYGTDEALAGFKRAAAAHGWKVPQGTDALLQRR